MIAREPGGDFGWRNDNLGQLLFRARDRCVRDKLLVLHGLGYGTITNAQLALFHNLDRNGDRLTSIAARAGLSKAGMFELVARAVALGLVERIADATDERARHIRYTACGRAFLVDLDTAIATADNEFASAIGSASVWRTLEALRRYGTPNSVGGISIGRLLATAARRFAAHVLNSVQTSSGAAVSEPILTLFRSLDLAGSRLTDLAVRGAVTKQSMRETLVAAVSNGFVTVAPDPHDRRAQRITFTPAGLTLLGHFRAGVASAERACSALLGEPALADLRGQLERYLAADHAKLRATNQQVPTPTKVAAATSTTSARGSASL